MDVIEALKTRRSIRKFLDRPVEREKVEEIVDCGRLAPSANNFQPWEFIVVTDQSKREAVAKLTDYGKFIKEAPVLIAVFCKNTTFYLEDGSAATQNILLAAHGLGLASCWVAGNGTPYAEAVRKLLGVPATYRLVSLVPIGYPAEKIDGPKFKRNLKDVLHWEKF